MSAVASREVRQHVEHRIALESVIEDTETRANHGLVHDLISEADARSIMNAAVVDQTLRIASFPANPMPFAYRPFRSPGRCSQSNRSTPPVSLRP